MKVIPKLVRARKTSKDWIRVVFLAGFIRLQFFCVRTGTGEKRFSSIAGIGKQRYFFLTESQIRPCFL